MHIWQHAPATCYIYLCVHEPYWPDHGFVLYDVLLYSETLSSDMCHVSELLVSSFGYPILCHYKMPRAQLVAAYIQDGYRAFWQPKFECGCCTMLVFRVCGVRQNYYVFNLYHNPDLDDPIFYYNGGDHRLRYMHEKSPLITSDPQLCRKLK